MDNSVIVSDYSQMDRVLREERDYILNMCKKIKKAGCNVVLVQKSILRYSTSLLTLFLPLCNCLYLSYSFLVVAHVSEAVSDLALHFLAKLKIMVVSDIERTEVEFICKVRAVSQQCSSVLCLEEQLASTRLGFCSACVW
jgi:T-complex protein 1 subunit delta